VADTTQDFSSDETKSSMHPLCMCAHFCETSRKRRKKTPYKAVRRSLCDVARMGELGWKTGSMLSPSCGKSARCSVIPNMMHSDFMQYTGGNTNGIDKQ
jgi:hypothetical protein